MEPANEPEPERIEADYAPGEGEPSDTSDLEHKSVASTSDPIVCEEKEQSSKIQQRSDVDLIEKPLKEYVDACEADRLDESNQSTLAAPNVETCEPESLDSATSESLPVSTARKSSNLRCCHCSRRSSSQALESDPVQHSNKDTEDISETSRISLSALDLAESERWAVVDREGTVVEEDDGLPLTTTAIEAKMEQLLTWMLAPAIHGIPKLGVLGAVDRASELLKTTPGRTVEAAVHEVVAGSERTVSLIVMNFCIERIPVLGCPAVLLRTMWGNLRSILIIAALYGHDLETPRVQHEALLCLVPPGEDENTLRSKPQWSTTSEASPIVDETAEKVAKMLIKGALRRATGLQAAADCFELASILYRTCSHESVDEDGYVCILSTPASAARDFFKQKSLASHALFWGSLPLLLMGVAAPALLAFARLAPIVSQLLSSFAQAPSKLPSCVPALVMALPGLLLAIHALRGGMHSGPHRWSARLLWYRIANGQKARWLRSMWPKIVTMSVFTLHAMLPAISAFSSVSMVLDSARLAWNSWSQGWDLLHACACLVLGIYSGCQCMNTQLKNEFAHIASDSDSRFVRGWLRVLNISWAVARACCVLAAWIYALLAIDLATTRLGDFLGLGGTHVGMHQPSAFGFMSQMAWFLGALPNTSPLWSQKATSFCISLISVGCQHRLLEVLSRREVLLRLIGAEKVTASSICLLMKGVAVACSHSKSSNPIAEFFQTVAPSQSFCIFVVALRRQAVVIGTALSLVPRLIRSGALGNTVSFLCGVVGGAYAARSVLEVWYVNHEDLDSPALRIALLVPGSVSGKAKILLGGALHGARKRAVKLMAVGIIQRFIRWCFPPNPALTM